LAKMTEEGLQIPVILNQPCKWQSTSNLNRTDLSKYCFPIPQRISPQEYIKSQGFVLTRQIPSDQEPIYSKHIFIKNRWNQTQKLKLDLARNCQWKKKFRTSIQSILDLCRILEQRSSFKELKESMNVFFSQTIQSFTQPAYFKPQSEIKSKISDTDEVQSLKSTIQRLTESNSNHLIITSCWKK
jgi:hypothetical protein